MKTKALVIFYPECIEFEAILAAQVLHGENLAIDIATPDGTDYLGPSGIALRATRSYAHVQAKEYRVIIVPGGDTKSVLENETLVGILRTANDTGATFGAICAGHLLLASAGLLKGRRFTHGYGPDSPLAYLLFISMWCTTRRRDVGSRFELRTVHLMRPGVPMYR